MTRTPFVLTPVPPFRLDLTAWALRRRADNVIDRWDGRAYSRVLALPDGPVEVEVIQSGPPGRPRLRVKVAGGPTGPGVKDAVRLSLERLLGLKIDLGEFYRFASRQKKLGALVRRFRGVKPPRFASVFEGVINGIACQQMTLTVGIGLLSSLAERYGAALERGASAHAFPLPQDLADLSPLELRELGFSRQKGRAMIELSRTICRGQIDLERLAGLRDDEAISRLRTLRGVGRWTAEYVLLRGLGRTHVFPGDDVGARNNLQRWLGMKHAPDYEGIQQALAPWRRYGGLIYFHLLLDRLEAAGHVQSRPVRNSGSQAAHDSQPRRPHSESGHNVPVRMQRRPVESRTRPETPPMAARFKIGDHVEWNSEAGRVRGTIRKKITSRIKFKGYTVHASKDEPQYLIKSDKTDHLAMHKGSALKKVRQRKSR